VRLSARGEALAHSRAVARVLISLSHTRHFAVAHALLVAGTESPGDA
jgi:phosphopantetheinyl transferase (holo-ACP synthase)